MAHLPQASVRQWAGQDRRHYWGTYRPIPAVVHSLCEAVGIGGGIIVCVMMTGLVLGTLGYLAYLIFS